MISLSNKCTNWTKILRPKILGLKQICMIFWELHKGEMNWKLHYVSLVPTHQNKIKKKSKCLQKISEINLENSLDWTHYIQKSKWNWVSDCIGYPICFFFFYIYLILINIKTCKICILDLHSRILCGRIRRGR